MQVHSEPQKGLLGRSADEQGKKKPREEAADLSRETRSA